MEEGPAGGLWAGLLFGCSWESIRASEWFFHLGGQLHPRGKSVVSTAAAKHLFPRVVGVELVKSLAKELRSFRSEDNSPSACGVKRRQIQFSPFTDAQCIVGLSGTASTGSKYSRKERKSYSVRKACWILPSLWGQIIIWSQLGVSWSCVSLHQPRSCPLVRPTSGLGSRSVSGETRQGGFYPFYPVNPPLGQPVPAGRWRERWCWVLAAKRVSR